MNSRASIILQSVILVEVLGQQPRLVQRTALACPTACRTSLAWKSERKLRSIWKEDTYYRTSITTQFVGPYSYYVFVVPHT